MLAIASAISAAPFLLRAEHVRVAADPCLGFHEAAAVTAALGTLDKSGTRLAGLVALVADYL